MHIGLDLTSLMRYRNGPDTATRELVLALARLDLVNRYTVFLNREDLAEFRPSLPENFRLAAWSTRNRAVRAFVQQTLIPAECRRSSIDVLHSPSFLTPILRGGARQIVTVHDMTFFSMPEVHSFLHRSRPFRRAVHWSAHHAGMIHVPSEATRFALLQQWPEIPAGRIRVTPWGISPEFHPADPAAINQHRGRLSLPGRFILFVGTLEPRKNLETLVAAYRRLVDAGDTVTHLVIAGRPGWGCESILSLLNSPGLRGRVLVLGFVAQADLPWLYRAAKVFVYPSCYEGFGFPPLEALACGTPVISSEGSALEENLRGAAELTVPGDSAALAMAIGRVLTESKDANMLRVKRGLDRARGFHWRNTAQLVLSAYYELNESAPDYSPRRR